MGFVVEIAFTIVRFRLMVHAAAQFFGSQMTHKALPTQGPDASESEVFFRHLVETAPDAIVIVDDSGNIAIVNVQAELMFGYARDELIGRPIEMLLPSSVRQAHVRHRSSYMEEPRLRPMGDGQDLLGLCKDGSELPVEISLSPVSDGGRRYVSSVIRDVTRRRQMESDIIAARQSAERANKANSAFLAAASHDLRQPVQALSLLNGALRRTVKNERALQMIENQEASLIAMTNLLNSLLDISRLDAGAVTPEIEDFPIQRLIDRLSAEFARQAQHKGLAFSSQSCGAVIRSDPNLLAEVITNLVSNAIRYTESGEVSIRCVESDGACRLQVADTGIGIEPDEMEAIFREFHQCRSPGASSEGFGLGLAIVRRLTDLLDHRIDVESKSGKGSRFSLTIPTVARSHVETADDDAIDATIAASADGLIVLIEDDIHVANAWAVLLETEGYRVATAASAKEALSLIEHIAEIPVLVISDFHLQDGSTGVEAVNGIRSYYDQVIPAFIVSGDTSKVVTEARPMANCTTMSKPVDTGRLLTAARHAVQSGNVPQD